MVDNRVDNNGYWIEMAEKGLATLNPPVTPEPAVFTGNKIIANAVLTENSPDVPVTEEAPQQSENSIFIDPNNEAVALNSNNSGPPGFFGADYLHTADNGETWGGSIQGAGGNNSGDPAACIGTDGRWYVGFISSGGQGVSYSDDQGESWTKVQVAPNPGSLADKNHMWIDTKVGSPYENYLYNAWTDFGGSYNNEIVLSFSSDRAESWSTRVSISDGVNAGSHNQGVNLTTGPNGEVYALWTIYDGWPSDETAMGFAKSYDGGETWTTAVRVIENIRGIRNSEVMQNQRVNSFPVIACDISEGANSGNLYAVWTNIGMPGENTGTDRRIYMIRSEDEGDTWSDPIQVNQSENGNGYVSYFPWIDVDPSNGILNVVFYDNRNSGTALTEAWAAVSYDAGDTWEDFQVSDVAFTPSPIPGMAGGYMGDYLAIRALNGWVYPCWTDNRSGSCKTYVSPFQTVQIFPPLGLQADVDQETGACDLTWSHEQNAGFEHFNIYRNGELLTSVTTESYTDLLVDYGYYTYEVTAFYGGDNESAPASAETQYGTATIDINPNSYVANVYIEDSSIQYMYVKNSGVLDLEFELSPFFKTPQNLSYPKATGGGDEYIHELRLSNLVNTSAYDGYGDFTSMYASMKIGKAYTITVEAGNAYAGDQCAIWIDWNANGDFGEKPFILTQGASASLFTGEVELPEGSLQGPSRMRVRLVGPGELLAPTGDSKYGDVEDYSVMIEEWLTLDPDEGVVAPGDSLEVMIKFEAGKLDPGTYEDDVRFVTNDINSPSYTTYFTMNITDLQVSASAYPESICIDEPVELDALPIGGSGEYTYSWTSDPVGFTSDEKNPIDFPLVSTSYFLAVNDGIVTMYDTVSVVVNNQPEVDLGEDQTLCGVSEYELDAGNPGSSFLWSTGDTTQKITVSGEGLNEYWVSVTSPETCTSWDTVYINFAAYPMVDLGADTTICNDGEVMLDAGNPGATYLWSTGETTQQITVNAEDYNYGNEVFTCEVTSPDGCKESGEVTVEIRDCTSIDELSGNISLEVFPNPNKGVFNLKLESSQRQSVNIKVMNISGVTVYDAGQVVVSGSFNQKLDLTGLAEGIYSVFIIGDELLETKKIVIRK
jgi:hypothetical protein